MPRTLVTTAPRRLGRREAPRQELGPGEVRLRTVVSGVSHGTELNLYRGTSAFGDRRFDDELRAFVPAEPVDADGPDRGTELGYELVGEVVEIGPGLDDVAVGDLVHAPVPHADEAVVSLREPTAIGYPATRLPAGMAAETALFSALGCVALFAVHDARIGFGDVVSVHGLGTIGLLTTQFAVLSGATVVGLDPVARRREAARRLAGIETFDPSVTSAVDLKRWLGSSGVDTAIEVSGTYRGMQQAIASVRVGGRVVSAGFYQGGATELRLGDEWHHNRPTMVSSMGVWGCPHRDHPRWDRLRVADTVTRALATGRLSVDGLVTHRVPFDEAERAYALLDERADETIKVALTY